jgi:serine protease Do
VDGFKKLFAHDANIKSDECGGPVFDAEGNFYGINIARFSRTTTLAIPADVIRRILSFLLSSHPESR